MFTSIKICGIKYFNMKISITKSYMCLMSLDITIINSLYVLVFDAKHLYTYNSIVITLLVLKSYLEV